MSRIATYHLVDLDPVVDDGWRVLVSRCGSMFHSPEWLAVLTDTYGWSPEAAMVIDRTGTPVAGISWFTVSDPGGERVVALPFSDFGGPIGPGHDDELLGVLERAGLPVRCRIVTEPGAPTIRPVARTARWHGISVDPDPTVNWARLSPSTRRAVRKARREGVEVVARSDAAFVGQFRRLHTGVRSRKYRLLPQPRAFFAHLRRRFTAVDGWHPLSAVRRDSLVAATVYLRHGDTLYYKFNASDPTSLSMRPNDLLVWSGIELASRLGCSTLDMGASDDDQPGLSRFKRGFGAEEREIRRLVWGPPSATDGRWLGHLAEITARCTEPTASLELAEAAGDIFYRYFA